MPGPSRNLRECYTSRAECKMYAGALCNGPGVMSRLACEQAGSAASSVPAWLCTAPTQGVAWSPARSAAGGLTASSTVQPDSHGAPSSLAGTPGSLPQSWESGAGRAGASARQRQIPEPTSSHAISTAVTGLVRTGCSLDHFAALSSAMAGRQHGAGGDRFPCFPTCGKPPWSRAPGICRDRRVRSRP